MTYPFPNFNGCIVDLVINSCLFRRRLCLTWLMWTSFLYFEERWYVQLHLHVVTHKYLLICINGCGDSYSMVRICITNYWYQYRATWSTYLGIMHLNKLMQKMAAILQTRFSNAFMHVWIFIEISLKFVPRGPMNNIPALARKWLGADQSKNHFLNQLCLVYFVLFVSLLISDLLIFHLYLLYQS